METRSDAPAAADTLLACYDAGGVADSGALNDLTQFAAQLCAAPVALVTLLDAGQQHFLGRTGTDLSGTPAEISFCRHAVIADRAIEVPDTLADPRFVNNPLVTEPPHVRFYAGVPMREADGRILGTLCVLDMAPRAEGLTPLQREGLAVLARAAMDRLNARRTRRERGIAADRSRRALAESDLRFRTLADAMPQMVWSTRPDGFHDYYNARWYEFTGMPAGSTDGEGWNDMFHADDRERAWELWRTSLASGEPYEIEYRLRRHDGAWRWVLGRALPMRDEAGTIMRWIGTCTDIHEQTMVREEREIISQELSHRIKNIFAVVAGLIQFAARSRPEFGPAAIDLRQRITALGRAHDFVRPHSARSRRAARQDSLKGLLAELFDAYAVDGVPRVRVSGEDVRIDDRAATPLALLFHELATNASKYGALSVTDGHVALVLSRRPATPDEPQGMAVVLRWTEHDGPAVIGTPSDGGFGSQLIEMSAVRQLGGTIARDWQMDGLVMTITVPENAFSRG